jgi:hypothetical protein
MTYTITLSALIKELKLIDYETPGLLHTPKIYKEPTIRGYQIIGKTA